VSQLPIQKPPETITQKYERLLYYLRIIVTFYRNLIPRRAIDNHKLVQPHSPSSHRVQQEHELQINKKVLVGLKQFQLSSVEIVQRQLI
jgi:hypothetical protein